MFFDSRGTRMCLSRHSGVCMWTEDDDFTINSPNHIPTAWPLQPKVRNWNKKTFLCWLRPSSTNQNNSNKFKMKCSRHQAQCVQRTNCVYTTQGQGHSGMPLPPIVNYAAVWYTEIVCAAHRIYCVILFVVLVLRSIFFFVPFPSYSSPIFPFDEVRSAYTKTQNYLRFSQREEKKVKRRTKQALPLNSSSSSMRLSGLWHNHIPQHVLTTHCWGSKLFVKNVQKRHSSVEKKNQTMRRKR